MSAVFMHDFPAFSEVPSIGDQKAEVADKADNFQPHLPEFIRIGNWREITLGERPHSSAHMFSLHVSDI